jgi:hypothetical protein
MKTAWIALYVMGGVVEEHTFLSFDEEEAIKLFKERYSPEEDDDEDLYNDPEDEDNYIEESDDCEYVLISVDIPIQ